MHVSTQKNSFFTPFGYVVTNKLPKCVLIVYVNFFPFFHRPVVPNALSFLLFLIKRHEYDFLFLKHVGSVRSLEYLCFPLYFYLHASVVLRSCLVNYGFVVCRWLHVFWNTPLTLFTFILKEILRDCLLLDIILFLLNFILCLLHFVFKLYLN